ncbi:MAG: hypothetical protein C4527_15025 [Candidatus Omnitrophota bacterium]|jgi:hypothetical protein|nr:MAG: hypothetical protein C4527_15025 [Candidatus Omnitrophota bacterium]
MAEKLKKLYEFAEQAGGIEAKMRLAVMSGISSVKAATEPDSPENIAKLKKAIKEVTGKDAPIS